MKELLDKLGFKLFSLCRCHGKLTHKYSCRRLPHIKIHLFTETNKFQIFDSNKTVAKGTAEEFEQALKDLKIIKSETNDTTIEEAENKEEAEASEQTVSEPKADN